MDPDAALEEIRRAIADYLYAKATAADGVEANPNFEQTVQAAELADTAVHAADAAITAMIGLDQWLSRGGFLPTAWRAPGNGYRPEPPDPEADEPASPTSHDQEGAG